MYELIKEKKSFVDSESQKEIVYYQVYVVVNGTKVPVKAVFKKDAVVLKTIAKDVTEVPAPELKF